MAGKLGSADLVAATPTVLYTNVGSTTITANIRFCNRNGFDTSVRVAIGTNSTPALADWTTFDAKLRKNGILEDTGFRVDPGEKVIAQSANSGVSVRAHAA